MTEQQITEFDRWFEQRMDPELNLTPGDKELCRHAWKAALSHAEWEAQPDYVLDALDNLIHDNYERSYRGAKNRQDDAELIRCALRRSHPAPQVAVPEPVGWVKWFDDEPSFQPRDALMPEDAKQHGWQLVGLMRSMNAPTAPAGEQPVSDPDGLPDRVLMPRALTAENGAKAALMGEFTFTMRLTCMDCDSDADENCEVCGGEVEYDQEYNVPWTTIKRIYTAAVDLLSAPAPDEREIAAKALSDFADRMGAKHGDTENGQFFIDCAEQAHEEAARLRAGKGDE